MVFALAHNAMNARDEGWSIPNQNVGYEAQAALGVRGFMLDIHDVGGVPTLCHSVCSLGAEALVVGLSRIGDLLAAYPRDVFVLVIQDEIEAAPIAAAFEAAGLLDDVVVDLDPWPTLGELVDSDTRLWVTHEGARANAAPWYHAAYDLAWDNDFAAVSVDDFDCAVLRGDASNDVFLLNHFLTAPVGTEELATQANPRDVLLEHVDRCEAETGDRVSWLAVDFVDVGDTLSVVDELNAR